MTSIQTNPASLPQFIRDTRNAALARATELQSANAPAPQIERELGRVDVCNKVIELFNWGNEEKVFRPFGEYFLAQRDLPATHAGAIELPEDQRTDPDTAVVVEIGQHTDPRFKVGTRIMVHPYAGAEIRHPVSGIKVLLLTPKQVLGILEPSAPGEADAPSPSVTPT